MQTMTPNAGIGSVEVFVIYFKHCIIVPQLCIWYAYSNLWNKVSVVTEWTIVELFHVSDWNVQTTQVSVTQEWFHHAFPSLPLQSVGRMETVIGTKEDVLNVFGVVCI